MKFLNLTQFLFRRGSVAEGLIQPSQLVMSVWLCGIQVDGALQRELLVLLVLLLRINGAKIDIDDAQVVVDLHRPLQQ